MRKTIIELIINIKRESAFAVLPFLFCQPLFIRTLIVSLRQNCRYDIGLLTDFIFVLEVKGVVALTSGTSAANFGRLSWYGECVSVPRNVKCVFETFIPKVFPWSDNDGKSNYV